MILAAVFNAWETLPWGWFAVAVALTATVGFLLAPKALSREAFTGCLAPAFALVIAVLIVFAVASSFVAGTVQHHGSPPPAPDLCPSGTNLAGCPNYVAPALDPSRDDPLPASQREGLNPDGTRPTPTSIAKP